MLSLAEKQLSPAAAASRSNARTLIVGDLPASVRLLQGLFAIMQQHTVIGDRFCAELRSLRRVRPIVRHRDLADTVIRLGRSGRLQLPAGKPRPVAGTREA